MGKHGPCYHCGATSTPLWRNGPPDKPVLCNACGSRWRTKGSLVNYTPLHCRVESVIYEEHGFPHAKSMSSNEEKDVKHHNRKRNDDWMVVRGVESVWEYQRAIDEENSNGSSSGSAISDSDARFGCMGASDLTGPAQSVVQDSIEPSGKRTCMNRARPSSVEKLAKDLQTILQEQRSQSSCFSSTSDDDLLLERQLPTGSVEIGHGTILIRHETESFAREDHEDVKILQLRNQGCRISPAESNIAGRNPMRNLIGGKRMRDVRNQKVSGRLTIKSPRRFKACMGSKEPADGRALSMNPFVAADDSGDRDLLLDVPCNGLLPEGELLRPAVSFGSQQASNIS